MTDLDLDLILPPEIILRARKDGPVLATIAGELPMVHMLEVVRLQESGRRHERVLLDTPDAPEFDDQREEAIAGVKEFYEQAAAFIQRHATMTNEGDLLELTATQIITIITLLGSPQERAQLIADALLRVLDLAPEDEAALPLGQGSPASSSPSEDSEAGKAPTGARSPGENSLPSGRKRSARPRSKPKS